MFKFGDVPTTVLLEFVHEYCKVLDPLTLMPTNEPVDCPQLLGVELGGAANVGEILTTTVVVAVFVQPLVVPVTVYVEVVAGLTFMVGPVPPVLHE